MASRTQTTEEYNNEYYPTADPYVNSFSSSTTPNEYEPNDTTPEYRPIQSNYNQNYGYPQDSYSNSKYLSDLNVDNVDNVDSIKKNYEKIPISSENEYSDDPSAGFVSY